MRKINVLRKDVWGEMTIEEVENYINFAVRPDWEKVHKIKAHSDCVELVYLNNKKEPYCKIYNRVLGTYILKDQRQKEI